VREYGRQALMALRFLCKLDIVHNDIKLDNFLLTEKKSRWSQKVRFVLYSAGALS
jgi:thiamine kinase-like enzyme